MSSSRRYDDQGDRQNYDPSRSPSAQQPYGAAGFSDHDDYAPDVIPLHETGFGNSSRGYAGLPHSESQADVSSSTNNGLPLGAAAGASAYAFTTQGNNYSNLRPPGMAERGTSASPSMMGKGATSSILDSGPSPWLVNQQKRERRSKAAIWGAAFAVIGLIIIGVVVGVIVSNNNKKNSSSSTSKSSKGVVKQTDPNDPSTFVKDPNLHIAFYGMAYTPENSQLPNCGNKLSNVIQDIQLISQMTKRIRLYGGDCNQTALVLEAIKQTKVEMEVWLGNYPIATDSGEAYERQRDAIKAAIETYGTDHIGGITVGNEFMLNYVNAHSEKSANSAIGDQGADLLISNITDTRNMLAGMNLPKKIPVGTSDAGSYFNTKVLEAVDYGMANVHPWFANVSAESAAGWTANFFREQDVDPANALSNKPVMYIAETGWPTKSSDAGNESNGPSTASEANLQTFLDTFVCQANTNGTGYFFFEYFDEPWKDAQFGGVEGWWGLFTSDRKLKNIKMPTCTAP